ncbi:ImmA/IrrE family metallo-endopeptidase [Oscillibacter sp. MSJ-2]|uniref:ImmA/IrrE family metallo-endopeptidase n=1 Tax=Dysosmobacter acutus TaxID=2841504 RepID=A0ABS6FAS2_9FIRM|nr:ImmA/IrrE family metallo-endopeptidase [Dysosmobacter acutus]MBU5627396.1 ImmA/IrrE family metallo-endopeptidase [Dysosmobacter acutus]
MSSYGKYTGARDASWQCLLDCQISSLPVQVNELGGRLGIRLYKYTVNREPIIEAGLGAYLAADGFSLQAPSGQLMVFFNDRYSHHRIRFTVAHEYGHILLGHMGHIVCPHGALLSSPDPKKERDANVFASRLLAPACVLWGCGAQTAEEIAQLCDISKDAAQVRAQRMQLLRRRNAWLRSPLERSVFTQFQPYIEANKL